MKKIILFILVCSVNIFSQVPGSFNLVAPTNGSYVNATPFFDWSDASGVTYYQLYIDGALIRDNIKTSYYQIQSSEAILEGLHTWNVKAINGSGSIQSVETWSVRIDATQPTTFDLLSPSDNSWTSNLQPTLQWNASADVGSGLGMYQLWIDGVINRDNIWAPTTSATPVNPLTNGSHTWQIRAIDNVGNTTNSTQTRVVKIDNQPPTSYLVKNTSIYFDGTNDYISIPHNSSLDFTGQITIEAWINIPSYKSWASIVSKGAANFTDYGYAFQQDGNGRLRFGGKNVFSGNSQIPINIWTHVAVTSDGTNSKIYINGILDKTYTGSLSIINNTIPLSIGVDFPEIAEYWKGNIDEVRIWKVIRTQSEILNNMNKFLDENENGLVAYWHFNEGTGTKVFDESKNMNNGVMINGPIYQSTALAMLSGLCILKSPTFLEYIQDPKPIFSWGSVYDDGIGFQKFQLWIDNTLNKDNLLDSSWTITSPLSYGQHTWFVKGFDALGNNQPSYSRTFYIDNKPPNAFSLLSPNDSGIVNLPTPNLSWETTLDYVGGSGVSKYQLWINGSKSIDSISNPIIYDSLSLPPITTSPSSPLPEGSYTWFIKAYDKVGNVRQSTQTRLFYVDYNPPTVFNLISPTNIDTVKERRPIFTWHSSTDVGSGILKYELIISGNTIVTIQPPDTVRQITFDLADGNYTWFVKAYDRAGSSTSSNTQTIVVKVPQPPAVPQLAYPPNNAVLGDDLTPDLAWNTVPDGNYFDVQVSLDSSFTNITIENQQVLTINWTPTLTQYGKYYWRVKAHSTNGTWSNWTEIRNFTVVSPPSKPLIVSPVNNSINQPVQLNLTWNRVQNSETYRLQLCIDSLFTQLVYNDSTIMDTTKLISKLDNSTKYYWRVIAKNAGGLSPWSEVYSFTTIIAAPNKPTLAYPANGQNNLPTQFTFTWNKILNSETYRLQLCIDSSFTQLVYNDSTITDTAKQVGSLENYTKYYWRVNAKNVGGLSPWSDVYSFTTIVGIPNKPTLASPVNGQKNQPIELSLIWNKIKYADNYYSQLSTDSTFSQILINDSTLIDTVKQITLANHGRRYHWRIRAKNLGGISQWSDVWNFITILPSPNQLTAVLDKPKEVKLIWKDNSNSELGFILERKQSNANYIVIDTTESNDTLFVDYTVAEGFSYSYRLKSYTDDCESEYSNEANVIVTDVKDEVLPKVFSIKQNYPNPFNPSTVIKYELPKSSLVKINIYDALGREIKTLINKQEPAGNYEITFDAAKIPSGVYFYKITAGSYTETKKMILQK